MIIFLKPEEQHQHKNGGGWVANTASVEESVYVAPNARVSGKREGYTAAQIKEYGLHIAYAIKVGK